MMYRKLAMFLIASCGICFAEDNPAEKTFVAAQAKRNVIKSGLQPGDKTFAFHVQDVTGPRAGKTLCYACAFGKHSVINIQTKKLDEELLALIKHLDPLVAPAGKIKGDSQHAFVVYLTEDPGVAGKRSLPRWRKSWNSRTFR